MAARRGKINPQEGRHVNVTGGLDLRGKAGSKRVSSGHPGHNEYKNANPMSTLSHSFFSFDPKTKELLVKDPASGNILLKVDEPNFLVPSLEGKIVPAELSSFEQEGRTLVLHYRAPQLADWKVTFEMTGADAVDFWCSFRVAAATQLNQLHLFPRGTGIDLFEVVNFRNRHHTERTWPELFLGDKKCQTTTDSTDWQFAPHPTALLFRANDVSLFCGALDLPRAFGFHFAAGGYRLQNWHLDYGTAPHGQPLKEGEEFHSPRFRLFLRHHRSVYECYTEFGEMLVREGKIPDPAKKHRERWWREPLYCTWIDQCMGSSAKVATDLKEQSENAEGNTAVTFLNEALVRRAVDLIEKERLPIRTILLDDGWQVARGQWEPHPKRFPNLRKLVDDLHARHFKVVVWWNWAEIQTHAQVDAAHLMENGKLNRHGARVRDYSSPRTQEEYLKPLFHQLFSSDAGCFDLDGVKTDFLADKVHADMALADPSWRGEENYFLHVTKLFYTEMKRHKPDAVHIGCAGHYGLAEYNDINRTYDVGSTNWLEHEERAKMLLATSPGCPAAYDFHNHLENMDRWFMSARDLGASVQIGNVLWYSPHRFTGPIPADEAYLSTVRSGLDMQGELLR